MKQILIAISIFSLKIGHFENATKEQIEISDFIRSQEIRIETIISKSQQEIELLKEYRTALISEVVTGKVDVRDVILN